MHKGPTAGTCKPLRSMASSVPLADSGSVRAISSAMTRLFNYRRDFPALNKPKCVDIGERPSTVAQEKGTSKAALTSLKRPLPDIKSCQHTPPKLPGGQPGLRLSTEARHGRIMSNSPGHHDHRNFGDRDFTRSTSGMEKRPLYDPGTEYTPGKLPKRNEPHTASSARLPTPSRRLERARSPGVMKPFEEPWKNHVNLKELHSGQDQGPSRPVPVNRDQAGMAEGLEAEPEMLLQPETRPISHDQLVIEVKGIYAGLVMVEAKCIDIDERQSTAAQEKDPSKRVHLKNDQWQSLIALHKQLLHEHHYDFFLASQHPSASPALSRIAAKYGMPARMWRHGIHAFLEGLRHRLPESLEHMLAFIYIAYTMMALLYETVSIFEDTWIECLGDLGRYRMAIEDDELKDRQVWSRVPRFWYSEAADKSPSVGRLYHHLAILARPYSLGQLSLYARSLTCVIPLGRAGEARSLPGRYDIQHRAKSKSTGNCAAVSHFTSLSDQYISKHKEQSLISSSGSNAGSMQDSDNQRVLTSKTTSQGECSAKRWSISAILSYLCPRMYQKGIRLREQLASGNGGLLSTRILLSFSLIVPTTARTISKTTESAEIVSSIAVAASSLIGLPYVAFLAAVLSVAFYMAALRDPISVWGCMMSIWAFGWWAIKDDAHTTLWDCGT